MYKNVNWNTSSTRKSEPPADKKLIKKYAASSFRMVLTNKRKYMRKAASAKRLEKDTIK